MEILELSYLLRYAFAALCLVFAGLLTWLAIKELRWDIKNRVRPVPGSFLQLLPTDLPPQMTQAIPLCHTANIGRAAACDIRIRRSGIAKYHAIIYLFDGVWFIRPTARRHAVLINGVRIGPPTPLENGDRLSIGASDFNFISQCGGDEPSAIPDAFAASAEGKRMGAWLAANLFALLGSGLLIILTPARFADLRLLLAVFCLGFLIIANVYDLLLAVLLKNIDRTLLLCLVFLSFLGIIIQARLSLGDLFAAGTGAVTAEQLISTMKDLGTQAISLATGLILLPVIAMIAARTRLLEVFSYICAVLTPLLLLATLLLGQGSESHGATLWIVIGGQSIQLTEFAKITYLIVLASFFKIRPARRIQFAFAVWAALVFFLVMLLPDLGMAMILLPTTLLVFVVMTSEYWTTLLIIAAGTGSSLVALSFFPHVSQRLAGWTSLWSEVNDSNRQIVYSLQAIARGGLFGRGLANGNPEGIPLASSDMVFAIICEEMGLIAGLAIVLAFIILWLRSARIAVIAQDGFTSSLALGIGTMLFMEAVVVIGGVTGLIPLTGATLPLIAEGGSSVLAKLFLFAILIGLSARHTEVKIKCDC